jgi:hypothetical protein
MATIVIIITFASLTYCSHNIILRSYYTEPGKESSYDIQEQYTDAMKRDFIDDTIFLKCFSETHYMKSLVSNIVINYKDIGYLTVKGDRNSKETPIINDIDRIAILTVNIPIFIIIILLYISIKEVREVVFINNFSTLFSHTLLSIVFFHILYHILRMILGIVFMLTSFPFLCFILYAIIGAGLYLFIISTIIKIFHIDNYPNINNYPLGIVITGILFVITVGVLGYNVSDSIVTLCMRPIGIGFRLFSFPIFILIIWGGPALAWLLFKPKWVRDIAKTFVDSNCAPLFVRL